MLSRHFLPIWRPNYWFHYRVVYSANNVCVLHRRRRSTRCVLLSLSMARYGTHFLIPRLWMDESTDRHNHLGEKELFTFSMKWAPPGGHHQVLFWVWLDESEIFFKGFIARFRQRTGGFRMERWLWTDGLSTQVMLRKVIKLFVNQLEDINI